MGKAVSPGFKALDAPRTGNWSSLWKCVNEPSLYRRGAPQKGTFQSQTAAMPASLHTHGSPNKVALCKSAETGAKGICRARTVSTGR